MEGKENAACSAPSLLKGSRGKRKALAELPAAGPNTDVGSLPRPSKPRTRSVARARAEAEAEEERRRRELETTARPRDPKPADAVAAQAAVVPYLGDIDRYLRSLEKPRTRSVARAETEAEEERRRLELETTARPRDPKPADAVAAQAAVAPYLGDIDRYLRSLEVESSRRPSADYFSKIQKEITSKMRAVLVDWLVDVAEDFKLQAETLCLAVSYVDRFLTRNAIARDKLQLLGVTALLVAAKYEEIASSKMKVNKYSDITDGTYTNQQVVKMEADLLKSLNFEIGGPTVRTFLRRFIISCCGGNNRSSAKKLESMCSYLAELSLLDYECLRYLPSVVAAACLFLARFTISPKTRPWNLTLQQNTGYRVSDLKESIFAMHELQLSHQKALKEKYKDGKFGGVSAMDPPREIPLSFLED